jgi:hypothetical protein
MKILASIENEITMNVKNVLENAYEKNKIPYFYA